MSIDAAQVARDQIDARLRILLPEQYQETYDSIDPKPMRAAGLKFDAAGNVAWNEIWQSFCDLAMAGGPPHKGKLLEPGTPDAIAANQDQYDTVVDEICRGFAMAADLPTHRDAGAGWVAVHCHSATMADWLSRAIVMENVAARSGGVMLYLPAAPHFRLDKQIKNVVTVIAKTAHYWTGHMSRSQKALVADLFTRMAAESPLLEPNVTARTTQSRVDELAATIAGETGLPRSNRHYAGWIGFEGSSVAAAVWMMRALVAHNVMARREETAVFVPIDEVQDPDGRRVRQLLGMAYRLCPRCR